MEAVMNNAGRLAGLLISAMLLAVSCSQVFTTSAGSSLARDNPPISSSASLGEIIDIAQSRYVADPDVARELLSLLAEKDPLSIAVLSDEEKSSILNLGGSAVLDIETITDLANNLSEYPGLQNELIQNALNTAAGNVDTTVLEQLISDTTVLQNCAPDSILLASVAIVANASTVAGATTVMDVLAGVTPVSSLPAEQQGQIQLVLDAVLVLEARPDADELTIGDFDLIDLLRGTI